MRLKFVIQSQRCTTQEGSGENHQYLRIWEIGEM